MINTNYGKLLVTNFSSIYFCNALDTNVKDIKYIVSV